MRRENPFSAATAVGVCVRNVTGKGDGGKITTAGEGEEDEDICKACGKAEGRPLSVGDNPIDWNCEGCGGGFHEECEEPNSHRRDLCEDARSAQSDRCRTNATTCC